MQAIYDFNGHPAVGMSASSNKAILHAVFDCLVEGQLETVLQLTKATIESTLKRALDTESSRVEGRKVAGQDVTAICTGDVSLISTSPGRLPRSEIVRGVQAGLEGHLLFGFDPNGTKHHIPELLTRLLEHPKAKSLVKKISRLALDAKQAMETNNLQALGNHMSDYRELLTIWNPNFVLPAVGEMASRLQTNLGNNLYAWKPPGGGSATSIFAIVEEVEPAVEILTKQGWIAFPVTVSEGLRIRDRQQNRLTITAPHRLDFIGYADLGENPAIGVEGHCLAVAVEPTSSLTIQWSPQ